MPEPTRIFSVDAETNGLYGDVWAIGAVVLDEDGEVVDEFRAQLNPGHVTDPWVRKHIVPVVDLPRMSTGSMFDEFWRFWLAYRESTICVADFGAPVEAGLFRRCVEEDLAERLWLGPYPMHELGTALLLAGVDPDVNRREFAGRPDLVQHDPYDDALAAGLCWQRIASLAAHKQRWMLGQT